MDKAQLKTTIENLVKGSTIEVSFFGDKGGGVPNAAKGSPRGLGKTGSYKVVDTKTGRGKGGSQLAHLLCLSTGTQVEIGTPFNEEILNIVLSDGTLVGTASETEVPKKYPKDTQAATTLKDTLKPLLAGNGRTDFYIRIAATAPEFTGNFDFLGAKLNVGRFGQISVQLKNQTTGEETTLWSYNHASVIQTVEFIKK